VGGVWVALSSPQRCSAATDQPVSAQQCPGGGVVTATPPQCRMTLERQCGSGLRVGQTGWMPEDPPLDQQPFHRLGASRPLTVSQLRLLSWLTTGAGAVLTDQVEQSVVIGQCACGCSSVELATSAAPLSAQTMRGLSGRDRSDYISLTSTGRSPAGHRVDVVLHVVDGSVSELEIFDSEAGEGTVVDPDSLLSLDPPEVD
jgi:hypothetical protein